MHRFVLQFHQQLQLELLQGKRLPPRESPVHREVVLPPNNPNQGKLATIQPLPPRPQAKVLASAKQAISTFGAATSQTSTFAQVSSADAATVAQKYQKLNDSLAAFNPSYKPLGFTINSLSSCSES